MTLWTKFHFQSHKCKCGCTLNPNVSKTKMFTELNNVLNLDQKCPPNGQAILMTEEGTDGTFLIHQMISLYLKGGHNVCLVAFNQTFNHYNNVAMKMGINLNTTKDNECFVFVEGLKALGSRLLGQCTNKSNHRCAIPSVVPSVQVLNPSDKETCIKALYENYWSELQIA